MKKFKVYLTANVFIEAYGESQESVARAFQVFSYSGNVLKVEQYR